MNREFVDRDRPLRTLERLYAMQLEQARVEHAALARTQEQQAQRVTALQEDIRQRQAQEAALLTGALGISPSALTQLRNYGRWQHQELMVREAQLAQARRDSAAAHATLVSRHEQLTVVRRLRERRAQEAQQQHQRRLLRELDELALARSQPRV